MTAPSGPPENAAIEFHDSHITSWRFSGKNLVMSLRASVQRSTGRPGIDPGTRWVQDVNALIRDASVSRPLPDVPFELSGGSVEFDGRLFANCLDLPFAISSSIRLRLETRDHGTFEVLGRGLRIETNGEPTYVEAFP
ncbi:MAG: hypothetical protein IT428_21250 [Planctomycetaceae bacterium]|nr:hypothetical protein [Planctomycetaceae bacterium]